MGEVFPPETLATLREVYPRSPAHLTHRLLGHPLLELDALAALSERMRPKDLEHNAAVGLRLGIANDETPRNGLSVQDTIRSIDACGSWVLMKQVQQDPAYHALLHDTLAEIRTVVEPVTGPMIRLEAFIFVSSPNAVTPLHFDPEYNILLQIRGSKTMTLFRADDPEVATQRFHERYHSGGPRNLPWDDRFAARGREIAIRPGEAIYVPILDPHWVQTHDEVSVSLSITWRSDWAFEHADAHRMNARLRRLGLRPRAPRLFPEGNRAKSVAWRALRKAGVVG